jgi:hypothetical protein
MPNRGVPSDAMAPNCHFMPPSCANCDIGAPQSDENDFRIERDIAFKTVRGTLLGDELLCLEIR